MDIIGGLLGGALSTTVILAALGRWLGKVWLGRILEQEKAKHSRHLEELRTRYAQQLEFFRDALDRSKNLLQAEIDRSVFVTRVHFETEFEAYKRLFEALSEVKLTMAVMRPMLSVEPANEAEQDRRRRLFERLTALKEAYSKAVTVVENQSPFYPAEIYSKIGECLRLANLEIVDVSTGGNETFGLAWYKQGSERWESFLGVYNVVSDMIRSRIASLAILPHG